VVENLPLHLILPTCDAVVHQGGNGSILTAALHGIPQLVLPQLPDQMFQADRLTETGAAVSRQHAQASAEEIRDCLAGILTEPEYQASAVRLRAEMLSMPAPSDIVPELEKLAATFPAR
jgi:UDP:flavonoid glycosyltransferase YjiC (YdhE family)